VLRSQRPACRRSHPLAFKQRPQQQRAGGQQQRGRFRHKLDGEIVHGKVHPASQRKASVLAAKRAKRQTINVQIIEREQRWASRAGYDGCVVQQGVTAESGSGLL